GRASGRDFQRGHSGCDCAEDRWARGRDPNSRLQLRYWRALSLRAGLPARAMTGLDRRTFVSAGGATLLSGCVKAPAALAPASLPSRPVPPLLVGDDRLMRITVCLRPFRPQGP